MPGYELINKKDELREIHKIFDNGSVFFRQGFNKIRNGVFKTNDFEKLFCKKINSKYALAVTSGTAALRVALSTLNLKANDEIITQAFTFVATVEAIIESGAKPICCEIDETLNMSPDDLEKKITKKTKAVILVHMLGTSGNLSRIKKICKKKSITLIEDTAWGLGGKYNNKYLGTHGQIGTFSFDYAKAITTGEGGMIVFKNKKNFLKAKAWHDHGHENNPKLPRWKDTRNPAGFNYRFTEIQAAIGIAQLKKLSKIIELQRKNSKKIWSKIKNLKGIFLRKSPNNCFQTFDALVIKFHSKEKAIKCRNELLKRGLGTKILPEATTWHFAGDWEHIKLGNKRKDLKFNVSRKILEKHLSIPINCFMTNKNIKNIYLSIKKILD